MPKRKESKTPKSKSTSSGGDLPEVIVDFVFDHGLFHVAVVNVSDNAAYEVSVRFDQPFHGLGGEREMSSLPLFRCIEFLAPRKRIESFLDSSRDYFQRDEPRRISAVVSYKDAQRRSFKRKIVHDLSIYEDVSYIVQRKSAEEPSNPSASERTTPVTGRGDHGSLSR